MTTVLALETSGSTCSVAVVRDGERFEDTRYVERSHNQLVLSMIDQLCVRAAVRPADLDLVAFGAGPGSFTGIRIAAAVAQGIAYAAGAVIAPVSSSLAMAHGAMRDLRVAPDFVVTMIRSRRDAFYVAGFARQEHEVIRKVDDMLCSSWPALLNRWSGVVVGERPPWFTDVDTGAGNLSAWEWGGTVEVTAGLLIDLGLAMFARGEARDPAAGLPVYLVDDSPWQPATAAGRIAE